MQNQSFEYKDRKYNVCSYDINWQKRFSNEEKIIRNIFGNNVLIEHVGSTSVIGMEGKPCIDILVVPKNLEIVKTHISDMENAGYAYRGFFVSNDALLFTRVKDSNTETNIHFFPEGHPHIIEMLTLRDYLRSSKEEALNYSNLKKRLYEKYPNDYGEYRKEKDEYMEGLKERINNIINQ